MNTRNRWFLILAGLLAAILVFGAACGDDDDDGDATPTGQTPTTGETPANGEGRAPADQQRISVQSAEPQYLDPHRSNFEQDIAVIRMMFRGLYNLADDGNGGVETQPAMAEGPPEVNGNVFTVTLKENLMWSDGEPLTAQHFVDGVARACNATVADYYGYLLGDGYLDVVGCQEMRDAEDPTGMEDTLGVRAVDERTVEYTLEAPQTEGRFMTIMSLWVTFPARADVIEQHGDAWTEPANIVTNGPFVLSALTPGQSLVLVPNENWNAGQTPALQEITIRFIDDFSDALRFYRDGDLDITRIDPTDAAVVEGDSEIADELTIVTSARITGLHMQLSNEVLADRNVRLALSRAIDREALNEAAFDGLYEPATYWIVSGITGHRGNEAFDDIIGFDPEAAQAALAEAGYEGGAGFPELSIVVNTPERVRAAEFIQESFREVLGISLRIDQVDSQTRSQRFNEENFELFLGGWQTDYPDIENPLLGLFETGGGNNKYNCSNEEVDAAFQAAIEADDDEARIAAYQDVEDAIISNLCGTAPLWQDSLVFLVDSRIGGVTANGIIDAGQPGNWCAECWFVRAE